MSKSRLGLLPLLALPLLSAGAAAADAKLRETARRVRTKYQDAVIMVVAMGVTTSVPDGQAEHREIATGAVLTAEGVTVVSFIQQPDLKITALRMVLSDGREIRAKLIGRDDEHNLAFVAPTDRKIKNFSFVKFQKRELDLLDETLILYRMPSDNRIGVCVSRVAAEADGKGKPPALDINAGGLVFDSKGEPIGFATTTLPPGTLTSGVGEVETVIHSGEVIKAGLKKTHRK
jgi:hypothetical protein